MKSYHSAFETVSENELPEFRCSSILLRHRKTGCEVWKLAAEDVENSFAFVFRTPPHDSTGVAHIVEHSVLCGSEAYPVKDAFLVLSRRSLATFLNALTWPDKTAYPAASAVKADFFNLLSVYGDAVFHPLLTRQTFMQEAHHLEVDARGALIIKGVVYNEMRGDYASPDSLAGTASSTKLFSPGHPYSMDSGGDPERIPDLDYAGFKRFWEEHYHPSNCRIFLHGDIDLGEELAFLEERFLSGFESRDASGRAGTDTAIPVQGRFEAPLRIDVPFPLAEGAESTSQVVVNWLGPQITDELESFGIELLGEILLGHDGAPLAQALRVSELGEDLSPQCGIDTQYRQVILSAGLRGTAPESEAAVESLIIETIRSYVDAGIPEQARETAFHSIAFANREVRRGSSTFGLRLLFRALRGWIHGSPPEATLSFERVLAGARAALAVDPCWLEGLAHTWIIDNPHRTTVTVHPEAGLLERRASETSVRMAALAASLGQEGLARVRADQEGLAALQSASDPEELLSAIPMLRVSDLPRKVEVIHRESGRVAGVALSSRPMFTNGIVYLELAFPIDSLPREAQVWMPLFSRFATSAGMEGMGWAKVAEALAACSGGFSASLEASRLGGARGQTPGIPTRTFILFRLKALAERFDEALGLALSLLAGADTTDHARVGDLLSELGNDILSAVVPAGNSFAVARAAAAWSPSLSIDESWRGTSQTAFVKSLRATPQIADIASALGLINRAVFAREGLSTSLTADPLRIDAARAALEERLPLLPALLPALATRAYPEAPSLEPSDRHEAFTITSEVGFAAATLRGSRLEAPSHAHESVLAQMLNRGALWDEIRVKGGAYGASFWVDGLEGVASFSTYRDPGPVASFSAFGRVLEEAAKGGGMRAAVEAVIGVGGRDLKPLLPEEKSQVDFRRELFGIEDTARQAKRDAILATTEKELLEAASRLAADYSQATTVLISGEADVHLAKQSRPETSLRGNLP
ncbi:MAG: insulinase family protein [Spirochaetota bacterium]